VRAIIDLGRNLGISMVAEGVEDQQVWDELAALGCHMAQGYFLSPAQPALEMERWLCESPWAAVSKSFTVSERKVGALTRPGFYPLPRKFCRIVSPHAINNQFISCRSPLEKAFT